MPDNLMDPPTAVAALEVDGETRSRIARHLKEHGAHPRDAHGACCTPVPPEAPDGRGGGAGGGAAAMTDDDDHGGGAGPAAAGAGAPVGPAAGPPTVKGRPVILPCSACGTPTAKACSGCALAYCSPACLAVAMKLAAHGMVCPGVKVVPPPDDANPVGACVGCGGPWSKKCVTCAAVRTCDSCHVMINVVGGHALLCSPATMLATDIAVAIRGLRPSRTTCT
jgi:hypothetical protein